MSAFLDFRCRPSISGYRVATFDRSKFQFKESEFDAEDWSYIGEPPSNATDDELEILDLAGFGIMELYGDENAHEEGEVEFLVPNSDNTRRFNLYDKDPSAYLAFARIKSSAGIIAFANKFGPLGYTRHGRIDSWYEAIERMRRSITLWTKAQETGDFTAFIRRAGRGRLQGITSTGVRPFLDQEEKTQRPRLCLGPAHLLDALWMQLALAIDGSQSLKACVVCKKWFAIKSGRGRSDKEYCSNACRMRAYRSRPKGGSLTSR